MLGPRLVDPGTTTGSFVRNGPRRASVDRSVGVRSRTVLRSNVYSQTSRGSSSVISERMGGGKTFSQWQTCLKVPVKDWVETFLFLTVWGGLNKRLPLFLVCRNKFYFLLRVVIGNLRNSLKTKEKGTYKVIGNR